MDNICKWHVHFDCKEIKRLREDSERLQSDNSRLRADKLALMEMLERCKEYIGIDGLHSWSADDAMTGRIADIIKRVG